MDTPFVGTVLALAINSEKVFVSQERVSGFTRKGLTSGEVRELPGKSGNFREFLGNFGEIFGELPGSLGNFRGTSGLLLNSTVQRTSGEVAEKLPGKFGKLPGKSGTFQKLGEPDSLPATRQFVSN